jgi:retron-type reverse transcriptase
MNSIQKITLKHYSSKQYKHFDTPLSKNKISKELHHFSSPTYVKSYRHLPFITFNKTFIKYTKYSHGEILPKNQRITKKTRTISLASHHDSLLLKYYSIILNKKYEKYLETQNKQLKDSVIAYRSGKSNISGAKSVFDCIWKSESCWIIKGDFKGFFDNLNHKYIFNSVKKILTASTNEKLSEDWYSILKFITKYRTISQKNIQKKLVPNKYKYVKNRKELSFLIRSKKLRLSPTNTKGIPQGTALSAILANVYMADFDNWILNSLSDGGIYRRYSDDFVLILPNSTREDVEKLKKEIMLMSRETLNLDIESSKTKLLYFSKKDKKIFQSNLEKQQNFDYLGFEFTGEKVLLRSKSLYKFKTRGKHSMYVLRRDIRERNLVKKCNKQQKIYYLKSYKNNRLRRLAKKRLDNFAKEQQNGINLQSRKKITHLYLTSNSKSCTKNMLGYAIRAQKQLSVPIPGVQTLYEVVVEKPIRKQIATFGLDYHYIKQELQ